jgi:hypothetical protein
MPGLSRRAFSRSLNWSYAGAHRTGQKSATDCSDLSGHEQDGAGLAEAQVHAFAIMGLVSAVLTLCAEILMVVYIRGLRVTNETTTADLAET